MSEFVSAFLGAFLGFVLGVAYETHIYRTEALERGYMVWHCADGDCKPVWKDESE